VRIGFIGLGSQGAPMADMIHNAGFTLRVWARRSEICAQYRRRGIAVAESPVALGAACQVVCLCVTGDSDVWELAETAGILAAMKPGSTLLIHSTVSPRTCERLALAAAERGVAVLDAPVSGSGEAARNRKLLVLVGGDAQVLRRVRPVLQSYGHPVLHVGAIGDGQRAKIVNNLACIANMAVADVALRLGESVGLSRQLLRQALLSGSGRSFALDALDRLVGLPPPGTSRRCSTRTSRWPRGWPMMLRPQSAISKRSSGRLSASCIGWASTVRNDQPTHNSMSRTWVFSYPLSRASADFSMGGANAFGRQRSRGPPPSSTRRR
jgi:3-hydroxyisobutyrate dehydrogenase